MSVTGHILQDGTQRVIRVWRKKSRPTTFSLCDLNVAPAELHTWCNLPTEAVLALLLLCRGKVIASYTFISIFAVKSC